MTGYGPTDTGALLGYGLLLTVLANASYAVVPIFLNERFPTRLRATATAVVWNGGFAIGGLMTTFVSLASPTLADIPPARDLPYRVRRPVPTRRRALPGDEGRPRPGRGAGAREPRRHPRPGRDRTRLTPSEGEPETWESTARP